jgi:hypothetical protein
VPRFGGAQWRPIPVNFNTGRWGTTVDRIVVHHFAGGTLPDVDRLIRNPARQASYHFGVARDGAIFQWVDTANTAWATGPANARSVAIGHQGTSQSFTGQQLDATARIVRWIRATHRAVPGARGGLTGHRQWMATACPGDPMFRELDELQRRATATAPLPAPPQPPPPPPPIPEDTMSLYFEITDGDRVSGQLWEVSSRGAVFRRSRQPGQASWEREAVNMGDGFRGQPVLAHVGQRYEVYIDRANASPAMFVFDLATSPPRSWRRTNL